MTEPNHETIDSILAFWFGEGATATEISHSRKKIWWEKDAQIDQIIRERFEPVTQAVFRGQLDHWRATPRGMLACILCCDQFPRNMYRSTPESFAYDQVALALAERLVGAGMDQKLEPIQRVFAYLPYEHSEDIAMQDKSMTLYQTLLEGADAEDHELFSTYLDFARRHRDIIERFGRYPHRNDILGRQSTNEEKAFLAQPASSF